MANIQAIISVCFNNYTYFSSNHRQLRKIVVMCVKCQVAVHALHLFEVLTSNTAGGQ